MIRLIAFDLDDTIADLGRGITPDNVARLRELEASGIRIAICSGKPTYYLCGFMRQVGLEEPILIGENGAVIQFGIQLPPERYYVQSYSDKARKSIRLLASRIAEELPEMWYQPNVVGLTPFPASAEEFDRIQRIIDESAEQLEDVVIYRHVDSFDITPVGIDKHTGMEFLGSILGLAPSEVAAVGNGVNDYPMFDYAGLSIGVNIPDPGKADVCFSSIEEALGYLKEVVCDR